ncbi:MAG: PspA/IM30 family protein [Flammeovirgaceae bacterium]|nr:PspA/IM30 family protein [Flammeovirgaceae bacterium]MDW8287438.1 PspA/IM30 family protein [Flammeovirgaceae bacterium]
MWKRISNLLKSNCEKTKDSKEVITLALQEIEQAIVQQKATLRELSQNKEYIVAKHEKLKKDSDYLNDELAFAVRSHRDDLADELIRRKMNIDKQINEYKGLIKNLSSTIHQVETQIRHLELKREEAKSKELVLMAKVQTAKTEIELKQHLEEIYSSSELEKLEQQAEQLQIEAELSKNVVELDKQLDAIQGKQALEEFKNELNVQEQLTRKQREEQRQKRIELMLSATASQEAKLMQEKAKELHDKKIALFQYFKETDTSNNDALTKKKLLDTFFSPSSSQEAANSTNISDKVKDFFEKTNTTSIPEKARAFFEEKTTPPLDPKKKLLDDFFGKS